jgi:CheY-like chemotaxis protein
MVDERSRVLLVDDDWNDVAVALRAFRRAELGDHVRVVRSGDEALHYLRGTGPYAQRDPQERPSVIFLDLKMPGLDGWDVLREVRGDPSLRDVPVVILSSSSEQWDVQRSYRLGANSYIAKRFDSPDPGSYLVEAAQYWLSLNLSPPVNGWEERA